MDPALSYFLRAQPASLLPSRYASESPKRALAQAELAHLVKSLSVINGPGKAWQIMGNGSSMGR